MALTLESARFAIGEYDPHYKYRWVDLTLFFLKAEEAYHPCVKITVGVTLADDATVNGIQTAAIETAKTLLAAAGQVLDGTDLQELKRVAAEHSDPAKP